MIFYLLLKYNPFQIGNGWFDVDICRYLLIKGLFDNLYPANPFF